MVQKSKLRVLILEDSEDDVLLILRTLRKSGLEIDYQRVDSPESLEEALASRWDIILVDYSLPSFTGLDALSIIRGRGIETPVIMVSGAMGEDIAVAALKAGANDYLMKDNLSKLAPDIQREMKEASLRRAHKNTEKENLLLATAIEQAAEAITITDPNGVIQYVNPAFEKISGYSRDEIIGAKPSVVKSGQHTQAFYEELWRSIRAGKIWHGHFINKRKDGSLYEEEAVISPVHGESGRIVNYVSVKRDVTQEVALEKQATESQKMAAIGLLSHKVAHDLTNMLVIIQGHAQLAKKEASQSPVIKEHLDMIMREVGRICTMTAELLAFANPAPLSPDVSLLDKIVAGIEGMLKRTAPPNINVRIETKPGVRVNTDIPRLEQAILHVVMNAVDAMPDGGDMIIRAGMAGSNTEDTLNLRRNVALQSPQPERWAVIAVTDTGCGIPEDVVSRVFDPFYTTKKSTGHAGLGLATAYRIVKQHDGYITIRSKPGVGSTVRIFLPIVE